MDEKFFDNSDNRKKEKENNNQDESEEFKTLKEELEISSRPKLPKIEIRIPKNEKTILEPDEIEMEEVTSSPVKDYKRVQRTVAAIFYIIIVIATIITILGVIWTSADVFITPTGKLELFLALNLGYQIAIVGSFLAGLFFLLVFFFGLFKKSSRSLIEFIYKKRELEEKYKNRTDVKVAAGGLLISLIGIILGVIYAIIWDIITGPSAGSFSILNLLDSTGPLVLFIGIGLFLLIGAALFLVYFWKNGYYLILKLLGILEKEDKKK